MTSNQAAIYIAIILHYSIITVSILVPHSDNNFVSASICNCLTCTEVNYKPPTVSADMFSPPRYQPASRGPVYRIS